MKAALILHGWPTPIDRKHILVRHLSKKGFKTYFPYLFDYRFDKSIFKSVENDLKGKRPDIIIGFSLGGLLAQHIALDYPAARLVLVGTGVKLDSDIPLIHNIQHLIPAGLAALAVKIAARLPVDTLNAVQDAVLRSRKGRPDSQAYKRIIEENRDSMRKLSLKKTAEIFRFARKIDTASILNDIKNDTLIICGEYDTTMPKRQSILLMNGIKVSTMLAVKKEHYEIIDEKTCSIISSFAG